MIEANEVNKLMEGARGQSVPLAEHAAAMRTLLERWVDAVERGVNAERIYLRTKKLLKDTKGLQ